MNCQELKFCLEHLDAIETQINNSIEDNLEKILAEYLVKDLNELRSKINEILEDDFDVDSDDEPYDGWIESGAWDKAKVNVTIDPPTPEGTVYKATGDDGDSDIKDSSEDQEDKS